MNTTTDALTSDDFDELDTLLDDMRTRDAEVPQWEFCEGFLAAVVCTREPISDEEAVDALLPEFEGETALFANAEQKQRFMVLWARRRTEIVASLQAKVESLDDDRAFSPEVMDVRGAVAALPEDERAAWEAESTELELPSFAQVWALGFMYVVENWPEAWEAPRDRETAQWLDDSLQKMVALTEDDTHTPDVSMYAEDGPPSVSQVRLNSFGEALWAVYDLHQIWSSLGPRVGTVVKAETPGRNDPCHCGSGKKFKKCHGA